MNMTDPTMPSGPPTDLDYGSLTALFVNCTLKRSPAPSHTDLLMGGLAKMFQAHGVAVDQLRAIDHRIATGMSPDMTKEGWSEDEWPSIFKRVMAADILVIGTPLWLGEKTSVCTRIIERLYSSSSTYNDKGQFTYVDKVAGWIVTGNEDGVKHASMNLSFSLSHLGYTIPPNPDAGWIGEIGPGPSFGDDETVGLDNAFTLRNISMMAWNLMHMAAILKLRPDGFPAWGNAMKFWLEDDERFGTPTLRELVGLEPQ